jgi:hypothetical protein
MMSNPSRRPDYNTPTQLHAEGVAANQGTVMLERGWWSYRDQESKKFLLRLQYVMPAAKAIPRPGDAIKRTDGASQLLMGNMLGEDRSTMNRDVQLFSGEEAQIAFLLNKWRPGIGCVNRYSRRTAEQEPEQTKENALKSNDPAELARRYGEDLFDARMNGASGAGRVALWTFDENMPRPLRCVCRKGQMKFNFSSNCMKCGGKGYTLDPERKMGANARVLLIVLQLKGIVSFGYLDMTCAAIGELAGMHEDTVAECLDAWEDLKVLQIIPRKVTYDRAGAVVHREPQRIIWLPGLLLDDNIVRSETERFAVALARTLELAKLNGWSNGEIHLARIAALHTELLRRWFMSRHSLGAFWNAMRKLIEDEQLTPNSFNRRTKRWEDYRSYLFPVHLE